MISNTWTRRPTDLIKIEFVRWDSHHNRDIHRNRYGSVLVDLMAISPTESITHN